MKPWLLLLAVLPAPAFAEVILACRFDGLPQIVMRYPDSADQEPTMSVDNRPPVEMTFGSGTMRFESATVDGYKFRFSPAGMTMDVDKDLENLLNGAPGSCITIGGPTNEAPLSLDLQATSIEQPPSPGTKPVAAVDTGAWQIRESESAFDDSSTVVLSLDAETAITAQYGGLVHPSMFLRCMENRTSVYFHLGGYFLSDIDGFGMIDTRVDKQQSVQIRASASTDNHALGLWSGADAIPFIKRLTTGTKLAVRITPFNESPKEFLFSTGGLEAALPSLRAACNW